jgi:putative ABC transport system substrate-binding protein
MRRREFILGSMAAMGPMVAWAQQPKRIPRVGVLWHASSAEEEGSNFSALVRGFSDLGYVDGRSITLLHRFPSEQPAKFKALASELVESGVDILVSIGANAGPYAKDATKTIPVVFAVKPLAAWRCCSQPPRCGP